MTIYLTAEAIDATLRSVSGCGPGSEIVLSYDASDAFLDDAARELVKLEARLVAAAGEPYATRMSPARAEALIEGAGLEVLERGRDRFEEYLEIKRRRPAEGAAIRDAITLR